MSTPRPDVEGNVVWTRNDVDALERRLTRVDDDLHALNHRCASIEQDVAQLERRLDRDVVNDLDDVRRCVDALTVDVERAQRGW